jgi:hypothetical protein
LAAATTTAPPLAPHRARLRRAAAAFDLAYTYFGSMVAARSRDAKFKGYVSAVAADDRRAAGEALPDRERDWFGGPSLAPREQREAAQPREVRAGPKASGSSSDSDGEPDRQADPAGLKRRSGG